MCKVNKAEKIQKELFKTSFKLMQKHTWLIARENQLLELLDECENLQQQELIIELIEKFKFLDTNEYDSLLKQMAEYIFLQSNFNIEETQVLSCTYDSDADSGQQILQAIKAKFAQLRLGNVKLVNKVGEAIRFCKKGFNRIILIDEFIGTGGTFITRIEYLRKNITVDMEIKCCILAGMEFGIKNIESLGIEVFCPLKLKKGISDFKVNSELKESLDLMIELEKNLKTEINSNLISTYSLGYGNTEALFSTEGCHGNTPNSVFPIFWWPQNNTNQSRNTLLSRYEEGII